MERRAKRKTINWEAVTFISAVIQTNERAFFTYWDTEKKCERVVNVECKRAHYDNMQNKISHLLCNWHDERAAGVKCFWVNESVRNWNRNR